MVDTPPVKLKVEIDAGNLGRVIADAIEECMAAPVCAREHVEPMAEWEKELLHGATFPRVVKDRSEFEAGQIVAFTMGSISAIARVTEAKGGRVLISGKYLDSGLPVTPPFTNEVRRGHWMILADGRSR